MSRPAVSVVGIGADGCASLPSRSINAIAGAGVLAGGERQLGFFPDHPGERIGLAGAVTERVRDIARAAEDQHVCVLASGDPLLFGIGALVVRAVGVEHVEVLPQPSAAQWAFARIGMPWRDAELISVHGRGLCGFAARLRGVRTAACFTDAESSAPRLAQRLLEHGSRDSDWRAWVCEDLCGPGERVRELALTELAGCRDVGPLTMLLLARHDPDWRSPPAMPYRSEDGFAKRVPKRGLITKREVRTLALASLCIRPDSVVWDVGAGSGSVAIDAAALAPRGRVVAIEVDPEGCALCRDNARVFGADNVDVVEGMAPEALAGLPAPDSVFIGGSKGRLGAIVEAAIAAVTPGGRIVATAVTLDNVAEALAVMRRPELDLDVALVQISRGVPLARYLRYDALNPIHVFGATVVAT